MIVSVLTLTANTVSASTQQNDFGTSGGDLPDTISNPNAVPNIIFSGQVSGNGQLIPASDYDYLKVILGSNEGLAAELSFDVRDDFDISLLDSSGHYLDTSWSSNPEYVTTNGSGYSGTVYIEIMSNTHQPPIYDENYTITIWKFSTSTGGGTTQNDLGTSGYDLPDSALDCIFTEEPTIWHGNGNSPVLSAELDLNGDNEDWLSYSLGTNMGFSFEISYSSTASQNGVLYNNDFELNMYDSNLNLIHSSSQNNPEYVTTNSSTSTTSHGGTIYIQINRISGFGQYDILFSSWSTSSSGVIFPQYDLQTGADLPNTVSSITMSGSTFVLNGLAPSYEPYSSGEFDVGDDDDWFAITLNPNEGVAIDLSYMFIYPPVNASPSVVNAFDLYIYDANMNLIDYSSISTGGALGIGTPESVTTNSSSTSMGHGGTIYVHIDRVTGFGPYQVQLWSWTTSSSVSSQNDLGVQNYDLPNTGTAIQSDPNFPLVLNGAAPLASGVDYAELDLNGDNDDWLSFTLNANEGFAFEITYPTTSINGTTSYINEFDLIMYDANMNQIDSSIANNPEYVTTNNTVTIPGASPHGGTIYIHIYRYSGFGTYDLEFWTWSTSSTGGGGNGSGGQQVPNPCNGGGIIGSGNVVPDILEPNNNIATASSASMLPIYCYGLSFDTSSDEDFFEIQTITGVTYYVNLSFSHANGDIDMEWTDSSGFSITGSYGISNTEQMQYTATTNGFTYVRVYTLGFSGSNYDIEITTDNPGGGQSFSYVDVTMNNLTNVTIEMTGLIVGDTYEYDYSTEVEYVNNGTVVTQALMGPYSFTATATSETVNYTIPSSEIEGDYSVEATLYDASGSMLHSDGDSIYQEVVVTETTSSTTGDIFASNITAGNQYTVFWFVFNLDMYTDAMNANPSLTAEDALNLSLIDEDYFNFTSTSTSDSWQVSWANPTTMDVHVFYATIFNQGAVVNGTGDGALGSHFVAFIPQLPSAIITDYSFSTTATTNDFTSEGLDLVPGDNYYQQFRVEDPSGADIEYSAVNSVTATAQNMSFGTFYYNTPSASGTYCLFTDLYDSNYVQIVGDYVCLQYVFDDDGDGVANEQDLCANTPPGSIVDVDGCADSEKDTDGDGYNDNVDDFPYDDTQWLDSDGDGYGDNSMGNAPDAFPYDNTQWSDADGDGYGDNPVGMNPDAFPFDPTQWADTDGDGYGDNQNGNNPDLWPTDSSQWTDSDGDGYGDNSTGTNGDAFPNDGTQWADADGDGFGDNINGNNADAFPNDGTQWADADGDGYGDNQNGNNADRFPDDNTQWYDSDNDGYGDNQNGNDPDAFPADGTQWADVDSDGYGDNQNGNNPDKFPQDSTQWQDGDLDGFGDNANGNNPDLCPGTPFGETVDANGCSTSQTDQDKDGIPDNQDACANTPAGEFVNGNGCSATQLDDDNDGVVNQYDLCPVTPQNAIVDSAGCADSQLDSDNDGINNALDSCPATNPGAPVDGFGCAANQRDIDGDTVNDNLDLCPNTPLSEIANNNGCSESQVDSDLDGVFNSVDECPNTTLTDLNGDGEFDVDSVGCSPVQYDDDNDMIDNTIDSCPATPSGEQVDSVGCSESQLDEDNDDIWNSDDLCFDTPQGQAVDQNGCSETQKDDDQDNLVNADDACPNTPTGEIVDNNGCSLRQLDSDGDGKNDLEDKFPNDPNEWEDSDGDGITDRLDAYPQDATRSEAEKEESGNGFMFILAALFAIGIIGALLVIKNKRPSESNSPFAAVNYEDQATEANIGQMYDAKAVPTIEQQQEPIQEQQQNQTWEENGVHWSMAPDGTLSYWDDATQSWLLFQN